MARRILNGCLVIDELRDLKRGDSVYVSYYGHKYVPTIVTRVKTIECATIITIKKCNNIRATRFVGYYTDRIAINDKFTTLTIEKYWEDRVRKALEEAEKESQIIIERADALKALRTLKKWLFDNKNSYYEDVE